MFNMSLVDAFIELKKPSVWLNYPFDKEEIGRLLYKYPSLVIHRDNEKDITDYWFFQNKNIKNKFKRNQIDKDIKTGVRDHKKLGDILGFPPKAIENFMNKENDLRLQRTKIGVHYGGIAFMSYEDSIIKDLLWLKSKYKLKNKKDIWLNYYNPETSNELKLKIDNLIK
jgi:hypothetical protein